MKSPLAQLRDIRDSLRLQLEASEAYAAWLAADEAVQRVERGRASQVSWQSFPARLSKLPPMVAVACLYLKETGHPASTEDLLGELERRGLSPKGESPIKNLRSALSKCRMLKSVQMGPSPKTDRRWWFADQPVPANGSASALSSDTKIKGPADNGEALTSSGS